MVVDPNVGDRLDALICTLKSDGTPSSDDLDFLGRVAIFVGFPEATSTNEPQQGAEALLEAWKRGSRATADALNASSLAEQDGSRERAAQILLAARDSMEMPFYKEILDDEYRRSMGHRDGPR